MLVREGGREIEKEGKEKRREGGREKEEEKEKRREGGK